MSKCIQDNQDVAEKKGQKSLRKNMGMFVKGRWFPLIITLIVLAVFVLVMALFGWRITYAPELETSWDAVSGCAAWAGVFASFVAIWFAIYVPKKIADRQDKIALFEKRYECYTIIQNFLTLSNQIENFQTVKEIQTALKIYFGDYEKIHNNESACILAVKLNRQKLLIVSGTFLFISYNDELLQKIIDTAMELIIAVATERKTQVEVPLSEKALQLKQEYCTLCRNFQQKYLELIEKELNLVKNK